ncbi:hypothetical protein BV154_003730 [Haemophilus influenzae]|uniref:Lipoprotein n=1 Tax=Haemophilus influenzae TaxID=727 RepID=A0A2S9RSI2_HAEIF|nr:hypothetical protein [Haemophilus influenzae]PRI88000.1 hypothetical protein BV021_01544 [Haemophilus influenzae]PRI89241.1 hypothetical protein BV020_00934 [Haemophilus influenzae]PRJ66593.1 hypothetical protein BV102_00385 [Haemophilus influenzae]PRJ86829.1 hypothetical protein BV154_00927 [Haemophilus influenzae]
MKKLLSITAISLLLSGCFSSVDLPNSNSYSSPNIQLSSNESGFLGTHLAIARACIDSRAKSAKQWESLLSNLSAFSQQLDRKLNSELFRLVLNYYVIYMTEKHIPLTDDNLTKITTQVGSDKKLAYDVARTFLKQSLPGTNPCGTVNEVEVAFKQLVASKMR